MGLRTWAELTRDLLQVWRADTCVYDRGTSADQERLEALWDAMEAALDQGDAEAAARLLQRYHSPGSA